MISLKDVSKRYIVDGEPGEWVLNHVSVQIDPGSAIGIVGEKGAGKSTLCRLILGLEDPTSGSVQRTGRLSYPAKFRPNFQQHLTGRQNAKFLCRINGYEDKIDEYVSAIESISRLGRKFNEPLHSYLPPMKARLSFAISWAFDCEFYVADAFNFAGETAFGDVRLADREMERKLSQVALILAGQGPVAEVMLKKYCRCAVQIKDAKLHWFDSVEKALRSTKGESLSATKQAPINDLSAEARVMRNRINDFQIALGLLDKGVAGTPLKEIDKRMPWLLPMAKRLGFELADESTIVESGRALKQGAKPVIAGLSANGALVELFDVATQSYDIRIARRNSEEI